MGGIIGMVWGAYSAALKRQINVINKMHHAWYVSQKSIYRKESFQSQESDTMSLSEYIFRQEDIISSLLK